MTVKELIEELQKYDGNQRVVLYSHGTCDVEEQTLYITVSDHLSELTDINLIIACACIGKTGMELTNTSTVQISCENALLDGKKSVVLQNDLIIVSDTVSNNAPEQE